jgi:hypothetical protein
LDKGRDYPPDLLIFVIENAFCSTHQGRSLASVAKQAAFARSIEDFFIRNNANGLYKRCTSVYTVSAPGVSS